jgi:hypothetical protein
VTARGEVRAPTTARVLYLALVAWGLGDMALGRRTRGIAWLAAEIVSAALVAYLAIGLADTSWYLLPFVAGIAFLAAWVAQAVDAYRRAQRVQGAIGPTPPRSPAAAVAWLCVPLLVWGTGFWLVAGSASGPAAAVDAFETSWPRAATGAALDHSLQLAPAAEQAAQAAIRRLQGLCAEERLTSDCADVPANLLRDVRFTISQVSSDAAIATANVVNFERRPSRFLGIFPATDLVPVPQETVLRLDLRAVPAPLPGGIEVGARRWRIVGGSAS